MKKSTRILLTAGLVLGFASTSYAVSPDAKLDTAKQGVERYQELVSAETMIRYGEILLDRSTVAQRLQVSIDPTEKARYERAKETYDAAVSAYGVGDGVKAKQLALESIRTIAKTAADYNQRVAKAGK